MLTRGTVAYAQSETGVRRAVSSTVYGYPRANSCVSQTSTIEGRVGRRVGGGSERPAYGLGYMGTLTQGCLWGLGYMGTLTQAAVAGLN